MLLAIDVGNTNTVLGVFEGKKLRDHWRLETRAGRTSDEYGLQLNQLLELSGVPRDGIDAIVASSVVPPMQPTLQRMAERFFGKKPLFIGPGVKTGMPILYDNPREVGADRIVNAVAAFERFGTQLIVVDFGTATTFDAVGAKGEYLGGSIFPGIHISMEALFRSASKLPRVELARPPHVIGRNTVHAIQAGLVFGYAAMVDGICERMRGELGADTRVVATGASAPIFAAESKVISEVDEMLTLDGLRIIYERNRG